MAAVQKEACGTWAIDGGDGCVLSLSLVATSMGTISRCSAVFDRHVITVNPAEWYCTNLVPASVCRRRLEIL